MTTPTSLPADAGRGEDARGREQVPPKDLADFVNVFDGCVDYDDIVAETGLTYTEIDGYVTRLRDLGTPSEPRGQEAGARAEVERLREALAYIADEASGWRFKVDPLEHARSVVDEMRDLAGLALSGARGHWLCTLDEGHAGPHVAHISDDEIVGTAPGRRSATPTEGAVTPSEPRGQEAGTRAEVERCKACNAGPSEPCAYPTENCKRLMREVERLRAMVNELAERLMKFVEGDDMDGDWAAVIRARALSGTPAVEPVGGIPQGGGR